MQKKLGASEAPARHLTQSQIHAEATYELGETVCVCACAHTHKCTRVQGHLYSPFLSLAEMQGPIS